MEKLNLAILASGSGSTGEVLFDRVIVVITNNPSAGVIDRAKKHQLACEVLPRAKFNVINPDREVDIEASREKYGMALIEILQKYNVNFISQNGWSILTPANVITAYEDHIVNSHPAPLDPGHPDFGGKGMHGLAVHAAVLNFAKAVGRPFKTEVTLHKVTEKYDEGKLLAYTQVEIKPDDSPENLQERVKEAEKEQLVTFWEEVEKTGQLVEIQRLERLILPEEEEILIEAKKLAIEQYPKG